MTTIGRVEDNDVWLKHPRVSRRHAQLTRTATGWEITDLGSSHGTHVNGEELAPGEPVPLGHNDVIHIGPFELTFEQIEVGKRPPPTEAARLAPAREPVAEPSAGAVEPPAPPPPTGPQPEPPPAEESPIPHGLSTHSRFLIDYLPPMYHTDFMTHFLALFESILMPIKWNVDNFDLYLDPGTAPTGFLPWLASWFDITFDPTWSEAGRRILLREAHQIYARRGTRWALSRVLEIYTGHTPEIIEGEDQDPFTFTVRLPLPERDVNEALIGAIIEANKPAHTRYGLEFQSQ